MLAEARSKDFVCFLTNLRHAAARLADIDMDQFSYFARIAEERMGPDDQAILVQVGWEASDGVLVWGEG